MALKILLANGFSTFFAKGKPVFSNAPRILPKNCPDCPILDNWFFDNYILADKPSEKALRGFETCVLVNNDLCGKLVSSLESPTTFDEIFNVTSVPSFVPYFNLLIFELDNFTFKLL